MIEPRLKEKVVSFKICFEGRNSKLCFQIGDEIEEKQLCLLARPKELKRGRAGIKQIWGEMPGVLFDMLEKPIRHSRMGLSAQIRYLNLESKEEVLK